MWCWADRSPGPVPEISFVHWHCLTLGDVVVAFVFASAVLLVVRLLLGGPRA